MLLSLSLSSKRPLSRKNEQEDDISAEQKVRENGDVFKISH